MADRLILCSECGTKNRVGGDKAGRPTCGNCGKALAVPGYSRVGKSQFSKPVLWFALGMATVVGTLYYNDPSFIQTLGAFGPPNSKQLQNQNKPPDGFILDNQSSNAKQPDIKDLYFSDVSEDVDEFDNQEAIKLTPVRASTGVLKSPAKHGVAPLLIRTTPGFDYYVKLANPGDDSDVPPVMALYISGGDSFETLVPLGTYEIRYAAGHTWYGEVERFGKEETRYSKADRLFKFAFDGEQYSGFTVELIMQSNGNLPVSTISADQF